MNILILTNNPNRASFRRRIEVYLDILRKSSVRFKPNDMIKET